MESSAMSVLKLTAESGRAQGSRASRRLRREDKIPAVMYGHGSEPVAISVERLLFRSVLNDAGPNAVITLDLEGSEHLTIVKDMQRDSIANRVTHVDFLLISLDERLIVDVPVVLHGEAVEAEREGSVIQQQLMSLTVEAPVADIPATIDVDITDVSIATAIRVEDLELGDRVVSQLEPDTLVVVAQRSRASIAAEDEGEDVEGEEGEEIAEDGGEDAAED
jgi:large subunit ribosomal protein L25